MRDDIPEAAFRLSTSLPCRTHVRAEAESSHWRKVQKQNHQRAVRIAGVVYESIVQAANALGCHRDRIRKMTHDGTAVYVDGKRGPGVTARPIVYKGRRYKGMDDAKKRLRIGGRKLYMLLASGQAVRE